MGDMDQKNQFQQATLSGDANVTVGQQAENRAGGTEHNNVHTMNNKEWKDEKKTNSMYKFERTTKRKKKS